VYADVAVEMDPLSLPCRLRGSRGLRPGACARYTAHMTLRIVGRSSSHFTRTARVLAHECGVAYEFEAVLDLLSRETADYAANPALRLPILQTSDGPWFGTLNICHELARRAPEPQRIVWPEDLGRLAANAQELVLQGMATEVTLIMGRLSDPQGATAYDAKLRTSLAGSLSWLDAQLTAAIASLPRDRSLSWLEVTCFCFVTHLEFRSVIDTRGYAALQTFCQNFAARPSALATPYRVDT
jgi:glutathione S-transferase